MMISPPRFFLAALLFLVANAHAAPNVPSLSGYIDDHMVIQRDVPTSVWGTAPAGATITVAIAGKTVTTKAVFMSLP